MGQTNRHGAHSSEATQHRHGSIRRDNTRHVSGRTAAQMKLVRWLRNVPSSRHRCHASATKLKLAFGTKHEPADTHMHVISGYVPTRNNCLSLINQSSWNALCIYVFLFLPPIDSLPFFAGTPAKVATRTNKNTVYYFEETNFVRNSAILKHRKLYKE